ncbi:sortase family protein [Streptomyces sp. YIM S03343]
MGFVRAVALFAAGMLTVGLLAACSPGGGAAAPVGRGEDGVAGVSASVIAPDVRSAGRTAAGENSSPSGSRAPVPLPTPPTGTPGTPGASAPAPRTTTPPSSPAPRAKGPDLSRRSAPPSSAEQPKASAPASGPSPAPGRAVLRIGGWTAGVVRGGQDEVDACRNAVQWAGPEIGRENGYELRTVVIVGHDYCNGFDRFAALPNGSRVTLTTVRGTFTYQVYGHYLTPGRGVPAAGLYWGDLTLQSCVGPDTGFSYLVRV